MLPEIRNRLFGWVVGPLAIYVIACLVQTASSGSMELGALGVAVLTGMVLPFWIPKAVASALDEVLNKQGSAATIKCAKGTLLLGLLSAPLLLLINKVGQLFVFGLIGALLALIGLYYWVGTARSPEVSPTLKTVTSHPGRARAAQLTFPPPSVTQARRPQDVPASQLREAKKLAEYPHGGFYEQYLTFSPCGTIVATWTPEEIRLFDPEAGEIGRLAGPKVPLAFSPDGKRLYTCGEGAVDCWSCTDLTRVGSQTDVNSGDCAEDGAWKATAWRGGPVKLINPTTGLIVPLLGDNWDRWNPYSAFYCATRDLILSSYGSGLCAILDAKTLEPVWTSPNVRRDVTAVCACQAGECAAFGTMGGSVFVIDLRNNEIAGQAVIPGEIRCMAMAPDGVHVAIGCGDLVSDVVIVNVNSGPVAVAKPGFGNNWSVGFSPDGKTLAVGDDGRRLSLWAWQ